MAESPLPAGPWHAGTTLRSPISKVLALGYYDGPTDGVLTCASGEVFKFDLLDEVPADVRHYSLAPLPVEAWTALVNVISPYEPPRWPVWCPLWRFPSDVRPEIERQVAAILQQAGQAQWLIEAEDLLGTIQVKQPGLPFYRV
jgi:hypothetical protein